MHVSVFSFQVLFAIIYGYFPEHTSYTLHQAKRAATREMFRRRNGPNAAQILWPHFRASAHVKWLPFTSAIN